MLNPDGPYLVGEFIVGLKTGRGYFGRSLERRAPF
jgi:hypothetical protein